MRIRDWDGKDVHDLMSLLKNAWANPDIAPSDILDVCSDPTLSEKWRGRIPSARIDAIKKKWPSCRIIAMDQKSDTLVRTNFYENIGPWYTIDEPPACPLFSILALIIAMVAVVSYFIFPKFFEMLAVGGLLIGMIIFFCGGILITLMIFDGITR